MSEQTQGRVPRLRFPEFREAGEWKPANLGEVASFFKGKGLPKSEIDPKGKTPCIHYGELFTEYAEVIAEVRNRTNLVGKLVLSNKNDVLMPTSDVTPSGLAKASCLKRENVILGGDILIIRPIGQRVAGEFLARQIRHLEKEVLKLVTGSTVFHLYANSIDKLQLAIPKIPEQQKISACLSSLDALIAAQADKLDALKTHKKGLMQQLFPREGETVPRLRFPEFREAGEWIVKQLEDISDIKTGPFGSVLHESDYVETGTPIITVEHLGETEIEGENAPRVSDSDRQRLASYSLNEGDIVFSRVGSVDRSAIVTESEKGWLFSGRLLRLRVTSTNNSALFLNQLLKNEPSKAQIRNSAVGQTMASLNTAILKSIALPFPSAPEQQKIAACLSSLDTLITAQADKLDALKQHKKGLMQQLFPRPEA